LARFLQYIQQECPTFRTHPKKDKAVPRWEHDNKRIAMIHIKSVLLAGLQFPRPSNRPSGRFFNETAIQPRAAQLNGSGRINARKPKVCRVQVGYLPN
jgi:hypothetical protein